MSFIIPIIILLILIYGYIKGVKVYDSFIEGAGEGLLITFRILPYIGAMLLAVGMLRSSGGLDFLLYILRPFTSAAGIPEESSAVIIMKPLSERRLGIPCGYIEKSGSDNYAEYWQVIIMTVRRRFFIQLPYILVQ